MSFREPHEIVESLETNGFCFPIDVMPEREALAYRARFEDLRRRCAGEKLGNKTQLNYPHVILRFAREIAGDARVLDAVEPIIGPDIMIWSSSILIKASVSSPEIASRSSSVVSIWVSWSWVIRWAASRSPSTRTIAP